MTTGEFLSTILRTHAPLNEEIYFFDIHSGKGYRVAFGQDNIAASEKGTMEILIVQDDNIKYEV